MLIIGAKGFAKELLEIFHQKNQTENLCFYDDVNTDAPDFLFEKFKVLKTENEAKQYFEKVSPEFTIGIGNPKLRHTLYKKFCDLGGIFTTIISDNAEIGSYGVTIDNGCNILSGVKISNDVNIGMGTLIYYNSVITHDAKIGEFCEISPSVNILGRAEIGDFTHVATGSIIFPDVKIGKNCIIAAGSVVRNNFPNNVMVAGIPAIIKKELS